MTSEAPRLPGFRYVDRDLDLADSAPRLETARAIAVDTEADSMHSFFEKVCLVQLATETGDAWVVDPLAVRPLDPLGRAFADDRSVKVFHGADFDVMSLRRDFGFSFRNVFDTMVASQLLGDEKLSLRDLVERFFGVVLEKAYTHCDWGRRPLDERQLEYCYLDVAYLVPLMEIQRSRLEEADLLEEAAIEFDRLAKREPQQREFDPFDWTRIKGSRDLSPVQQAALHGMFAVREQHARRLDRPLFKVIGSEPLLRLAQKLPETTDDVRAVKGVSAYVAGRMAKEFVAAVEHARRVGAPPPRPRPPLDPERRMDIHAQHRLGALKEWRNQASQRSRRTTFAILPNYAMFEVARLRPADEESLAAIPGVGRKRAAEWGGEILPLLKK
ncbi:MAG: Ribonuclease D [Planctomycetes bacterium]|nr:Ribonuclease D [Planctomycetota bacterium]